MKFWNFTEPENQEEAIELRISGEIVDDDSAWVYEWCGIPAASPNAFREELKAYSGRDVAVWVDSWGGDTTAAAGIYNALKEHNGKVTVKIDGKAVSAASVIAMAGDVVQMSPVGVMMIHNPWTGVSGEAKDLRQVADVLDVIKQTIVNAYQLKTGQSKNKIAKMMDDETWMSAEDAKKLGFVDEILYQSTDSTSPAAQSSYMFSHLAIQNSASASMRRFISNMKPKEEKKNMNLDELKNQSPDLVKQIQDEAITTERGRVAALDALDDVTNPAVHDMIVLAKAQGKTAEEVQAFVDIVKNQTPLPAAPPTAPANKAQDFMTQALADNKASGADGVKSSAKPSGEQDEAKSAAAYMANIMNKKLGSDK